MTIFDYNWDFRAVWESYPALVRGFWVTVQLGSLVIVIGTPLGIVWGSTICICRGGLKRLALLLNDTFRALPALILILVVYYYVPALLGNPEMEPFELVAIALTANLTAFVADIIRADIDQFPAPLLDAATTLRLTSYRTLYSIVLPDVVRRQVPTIALLWIDVLKMCSLGSVVAVAELVHTADRIRSQTFRPMEVFAIVGVAYILLILPLSWGVRLLENSPMFRRRA